MYAALEKHRCLPGGGICQVPGADEATSRMTRWLRLAISASGAGQLLPAPRRTTWINGRQVPVDSRDSHKERVWFTDCCVSAHTPMVNGWIDRRRSLSDDAPDLIIEGRPGGYWYRVTPRHHRATNWLESVGDSVAVDERCLGDLVAAAVSAGFTVALR
jgi:hypothetical protein